MKKILLITAIAFLPLSPTRAEVKTKSENGFAVLHIAEVDASPDEIWARLIKPKDYWSAEHSWSGNADGFSIDPRPGGCFCESIGEEQPDGTNKIVGNVEHMRVIFAQPGTVLRMQGALGPLQSEAVLGTLTAAIVPQKSGKGSKLSFSYVVGGYMRYKVDEIAPAVDKVIGEQFAGLISPFAKTEEKISSWTLNVEELGLADEAVTGDEDFGPSDELKTDKEKKEKPKDEGKVIEKILPPDGSR